VQSGEKPLCVLRKRPVERPSDEVEVDAQAADGTWVDAFIHSECYETAEVIHSGTFASKSSGLRP